MCVYAHPVLSSLLHTVYSCKGRQAQQTVCPYTPIFPTVALPVRCVGMLFCVLLCGFMRTCVCQSTSQCGNKLQRTVDGAVATVFAHVLRGLSAAKITRAKMETFRNQAGERLGLARQARPPWTACAVHALAVKAGCAQNSSVLSRDTCTCTTGGSSLLEALLNHND